MADEDFRFGTREERKGSMKDDLAAAGAPAHPVSKEQQARNLAQLVQLYYDEYTNAQGEDRTLYRNLALQQHRELVALVGEEEAARLEKHAAALAQEQPNTEPEPQLWDVAAYLRGKPIPFYVGKGRDRVEIKRNFDDLPPETQQSVQEQVQDMYDQTGDTDPLDLLTDFVDGRRGPTPEQLAAMSAAREEQARQRAQDAADKAARQAERDRIRQQFAEQEAQRKHEREARLDAERVKAAESAEKRRERAEQVRQADKLYQWQRQGWQDDVNYGNLNEQRADRAARQAQQAQDKQDILSKRNKTAKDKRTQLAAQTAQRAANLLATTRVRLEGAPMPGGIGLLLIVIVFILFAIVPVNAPGNTRLQLMWFAILPWSGLELPSDIAGNSSGPSYNPGGGWPTIPGTNIRVPPVTLFDVFEPALTAATSSLASDNTLNGSLPYAVQSF